MSTKPPPPLVQSFVVCREIYQRLGSPDHVLVAPFNQITMRQPPVVVQFSVFAYLTDLQGRYELSLEMIDADDRVLWRCNLPNPVEQRDPLLPHRLLLYDLKAPFQRPGRYHLVILANGDAVAHHALWARQSGEGQA
jgi:hypothetical protein